MDFSTMNIWCWLIPLLVGILCAYFGYLLGKDKGTDSSADLKLLEDQNTKLQADLDACKNKLSVTKDSTMNPDKGIANSLNAGDVIEIPFDASIAKTAMGKVIKQDDLKVVEGIGPKIAGMFQDSGISTWKALSEVAVAQCQEVLDNAGNRYKMHDPASWPMQAKMAYEGKWKELAKWQHKHKHGKL